MTTHIIFHGFGHTSANSFATRFSAYLLKNSPVSVINWYIVHSVSCSQISQCCWWCMSHWGSILQNWSPHGTFFYIFHTKMSILEYCLNKKVKKSIFWENLSKREEQSHLWFKLISLMEKKIKRVDACS